MRVLAQIYIDYLQIDREYAIREAAARAHLHVRKLAQWQSKRYHNDQATFLYLFTRLEGCINDYCRRAILQEKTRLRNWNRRRSWDILDESRIERIPFMNRVALLTDIRGRDYALVQSYYRARNEIAHGRMSSSSVAIPTIYNDIRRLYVALRP
jgi:hypothetical protein